MNVEPSKAIPSTPPPFFLRREDYLGDAVHLLTDPAPSGLRGEWVDHRNLSGERFFRPASGTHHLPLNRTGELTLRFRDRSMLPGRLTLLDASDAVRLTNDLTPSTEWQTLRLELPEQRPPVASLTLDIPEGGVWDIAALYLRPLDRAGWQADMARRAAQPAPANLLPVGSFPLGLPQGWTLDRSHSPETVFASTEDPVTGPSGCPGLPVTSDRSGHVRSPQMLAWGDGPHTASLWVRGKGELRLAARSAKHELAYLQIEADETGRIVRLPFTPVDAITPFSLELSWKGSVAVHLDTLRIAPPGASPEHGERGRVGIALRPTAKESLFTAGESLEVRRWIFGNVHVGDTLRWLLSDLYGKPQFGHIALDGTDDRAVPLPLPDDGTLAPLGSYRLEVWTEDAYGTPCSGVAELVLHRIPKARASWGQANPESAFGAHLLPTDRHLYVAKRLGINWVRLHGPGAEICYWYHVEPERGAWQFRPDELARYRAAGFTVLGKLTSTPRWASGQHEQVHSYFDMFVAPRDLEAWKNYVRATVNAYGEDIPVYEVWNEPWLDKFFSHAVKRNASGGAVYPRPDNPVGTYATLCRLAAEAVASRATQLVGLNSTTNRGIAGWMDGDEWTRRAAEGGALDPVHILSYHDYHSASEPLRQFTLTRESFRFSLGPLLQDERLPKPVWNTEGAAQPEGLSPGLFRRLLPDEPDHLEVIWEEAERQARYLLAQRVEGVAKIFFYTLHNFHGLGEDNHFTVLLAPDGSPHPVATSFAVLACAIDGRDPTDVEEIHGGTLIYFNNSEQEETQVFLADGQPKLPPSCPGFSDWYDLFGNPAADPLRGYTFFRTSNHGQEHEDH